MRRLTPAQVFLIAALGGACGERSYDAKTLALNLSATDATIKILPPNDMGIAYTAHRLEWQLASDSGSALKSITTASDKEISLKLNPSNYRFVVSLLQDEKVVASSQFAQCKKQQELVELRSGANTLPFVVCSPEGEHAGLVENRPQSDSLRADHAITVIPHVNKEGFGFQLASGGEERDSAEETNVSEQDSLGLVADDSTPALARVLAFGDSGTGGDDQKKVAHAMLRVCQEEGCNYGVMLGDNIYEAGVASPDDPQFKTKFEDIYRPLGIPFYLALGNHDEMNHTEGIQGQIGYSNISDIWHMDDRFFKVRLGEIEYFIIDTNTFSEDKVQINWLKTSLKNSNASWKVVFGHHPLYTVGAHGMMELIEGFPIKRLRKVLDPMLCKLGVDMYLSGHDHHLEVNQTSCGVVHVLSGASAKIRETYAWLKLFNKKIRLYSIGNTLGFAHLTFYPQQVQLKLLDGNGEVLFQRGFANRK